MSAIRWADELPIVATGKLAARPMPPGWRGVVVGDQAEADERIPHLLAEPAAVRVVVAVPLRGRIEFSDATRRSDVISQLGKKALDGIDAVIVGGGDEPCHPAWVRSIRDQCRAVDVPFLFSGWGAWRPIDESEAFRGEHRHCRWCSADGRARPGDPTLVVMSRVGAERSGRALDGRTYDDMPAIEPESEVAR